jgi:hypothetical protein
LLVTIALARKIWGPLVEEGGRGLSGYSKAKLELIIEVLRATQGVQEAHTERIRGLLRR